MIFTIKSLIVPMLRIGGRLDAACASDAATMAESARAFMGGESTRSGLISEPGVATTRTLRRGMDLTEAS